MLFRMDKKIGNLCGGILCAAVLSLCVTACGPARTEDSRAEQGAGSAAEAQDNQEAADGGRLAETPAWETLGDPERIPLSYAEQFVMDRYPQGYVLITVAGRDRFLVTPEGLRAPGGLPEDVTVIGQQADRVYLAASAVMDMFRALDMLSAVRLSGTEADGWCMEEVRTAMESGDILYAGKYSAPDYELLLSEGCDLAVENLMIDHSPEVREKLESFGIPVLVDYSSYESHPLGRVEWVKLYGVLLGREREAEAAFAEQEKILREIEAETAVSGDGAAQAEPPTVAFFYLTTNGAANVRKSSDYIPKMIGLAGGRYVFDDLGEADSHSSSITMQIEEFYETAKEADYLIYNSTIDGELATVDELVDKCGLLQDFRAVREGHVYCTTKNLYQESMSIGVMIEDMHRMLGGEDDMRYLYRLTGRGGDGEETAYGR